MCTGLKAAIGSCGIERDLGAADRAHGGTARRQLGQIDRVRRVGPEEHRAAHDATGRLDDLQQRLHRDALAAAALAHDPHHLAGVDVERHAVHRAYQALVEEEVHAQVADLQDGRHQEP